MVKKSGIEEYSNSKNYSYIAKIEIDDMIFEDSNGTHIMSANICAIEN